MFELASLVILIESIMWAVPFASNPRLAYSGLALLIAALLLFGYVREGVGLRELGLRTDNFFRVLRRVAPALLIFVASVLVIGLAAGTVRLGPKFFSMLLAVPPWALLQQYMLLAFAHRRFRVITGSGRASVIASAALFSLLHFPNPVLTVVCALGGLIWAREYECEPNLLAHSVTHTVASAFLANSLPGWLLKNMVVGYNYFLR
ncbi:MAG TPA: CPBP family glutamic-type intramembrane protease [Blastocatellia bacterium]|nr:CPBP family glutamic-type intramembrane protease [Blastocatellia bacterium]